MGTRFATGRGRLHAPIATGLSRPHPIDLGVIALFAEVRAQMTVGEAPSAARPEANERLGPSRIAGSHIEDVESLNGWTVATAISSHRPLAAGAASLGEAHFRSIGVHMKRQQPSVRIGELRIDLHSRWISGSGG